LDNVVNKGIDRLREVIGGANVHILATSDLSTGSLTVTLAEKVWMHLLGPILVVEGTIGGCRNDVGMV
jgi:hypothetical protein